MPKSNTPPDVQEIEEFWRNGQDARAFGEATTQREQLLTELVYASRSLATHPVRRRMAKDATGVAVDRFMYDCRACGIISTGPGLLAHKHNCRVGRVLAVMDNCRDILPLKISGGR